MMIRRLFVGLACAGTLAAQTFIQMSDPQFGMFTKNASFEHETVNLEFAIASANRLKSCRRLRGLPVLVHEVSRRVWGLRLRRTEQELALARLFMLPSAHYKDVGVRIASFRS